VTDQINTKLDNRWLYRIVEESVVLEKIMNDIQAEIPSLIRTSGLKQVRKSVIKFILDPAPFKTFHSTTIKFVKILRRHLLETKEFADFDRVATRLRSQVQGAIKKLNITPNFEELLGCSCDEFLSYIENQFTEGMTWENYGKKGWHIDHIQPLCSFILTEPNEVRRATHYSNLRPMWAKDNIAKSSSDRKKSVRKKNGQNLQLMLKSVR
jgi:hypothetical protein